MMRSVLQQCHSLRIFPDGSQITKVSENREPTSLTEQYPLLDFRYFLASSVSCFWNSWEHIGSQAEKRKTRTIHSVDKPEQTHSHMSQNGIRVSSAPAQTADGKIEEEVVEVSL